MYVFAGIVIFTVLGTVVVVNLWQRMKFNDEIKSDYGFTVMGEDGPNFLGAADIDGAVRDAQAAVGAYRGVQPGSVQERYRG